MLSLFVVTLWLGSRGTENPSQQLLFRSAHSTTQSGPFPRPLRQRRTVERDRGLRALGEGRGGEEGCHEESGSERETNIDHHRTFSWTTKS